MTDDGTCFKNLIISLSITLDGSLLFNNPNEGEEGDEDEKC